MAPVTRPRARGRGRAPGANPMPGGGIGRNKGIDPGFFNIGFSGEQEIPFLMLRQCDHGNDL